MPIFKRQLNLLSLLEKKSFFLLGPRATGKSYLIKQQIAHQGVILDLLRSDLSLRLSASPWELEKLIQAALTPEKKFIVIDEIQKIPALLDEVHRLIEQKKWRFLLTGSSARKLKKGHANLLAGRAWMAELYPLNFSEIPDFDLEKYLRYGGLPAVVTSDDPAEELNAYAQLYLREEIQAESLVRRLPQFSRFLTVAALMNGQLLNFNQLASDTAVPASTVKDYYSILEDTLLGFRLLPWTYAAKRKSISTAKFYFFDTGVACTLAQIQHIERNSDLYGRGFEHWIAMELKSYLSYRRSQDMLSFWRSAHQHEVNFIIGDHTAIEVKATRKVTARDLKNLKVIQEEHVFKNLLLVSDDEIEIKEGNICCYHWRTFIENLWGDKIIF